MTGEAQADLTDSGEHSCSTTDDINDLQHTDALVELKLWHEQLEALTTSAAHAMAKHNHELRSGSDVLVRT